VFHVFFIKGGNAMIQQHDQGVTCDVTRELQRLNDFQVLTTPLLQKESEQSIVQRITTILSSLWDKYVWLIALRSDGPENNFKVYGLHPHDRAAEDFLNFLRGMIFHSEKDSRAVYGSDIPASLHYLKLQGLHMFPIQTGDKNLGILLLGTYDADPLPIEQSAILRAVTSHLGLLSQTFHQWHTTRKHNLQLEETLKLRTAQHSRRSSVPFWKRSERHPSILNARFCLLRSRM
jgi:hypothetical protein